MKKQETNKLLKLIPEPSIPKMKIITEKDLPFRLENKKKERMTALRKFHEEEYNKQYPKIEITDDFT